MPTFFHDRRDAGRQLARKLSAYEEREDAIILALPRGGVPVAFEIAKALRAPLDVLLVRKLGVPGHEELALGAIAMNDVCVFNHEVIRNYAIPDDTLDAVIVRETAELVRRNKVYRGGERPPDLQNRIVILADDGVATGASMHAAISALAQQGPARIIAAVPVAAEQSIGALKQQANEVVCLQIPPFFSGVGSAYEDFNPTGDAEVKVLLGEARGWNYGTSIYGASNKRAARRA